MSKKEKFKKKLSVEDKPTFLSSKIIFLIQFFLLLACISSWLYVDKLMLEKRSSKILIHSNKIIDKTKSEFKKIESSLVVLRSFLKNSTNINNSKIKLLESFLNDSNFSTNLPGVQSIGYSKVLHSLKEKKKYVQIQRSNGRKNFKIWPMLDEPIQTTIVYNHPQTEHNNKIIGFDMYTSKVRSKAMNQSLKTNSMIISEPVKMIMNTGAKKKTPGFVFYLPDYETSSAQYAYNEKFGKENLKNVEGFFYVVINSRVFFNATLINEKSELNDYNFEIDTPHNKKTKENDLLIFTKSRDTRFNKSKHLEVHQELNIFGQHFSFTSWEKDSFESYLNQFTPLLFLILGLILLGLVSYIVNLLQRNAQKSFDLRNLALESAEKSKAANYSKTAFLANMSHEIRTPLSAILGYSEMLYKKKMTPEQREEVVSTIRSNGSLLSRLLEDILDSSKIEVGKISLDPMNLKLDKFKHEVQSVYHAKCKLKAIDFEIKQDKNLPKVIMIDKHRLFQIISNLLNNAIRFTDRGVVKLFFKNVDENEERFLEIDVIDTGIGIPQKLQSNIFENFRQADVSTTRKYGGTGIGLSLSKKLAKLMGGNVWLHRSLPESGSHFKARVKYSEIDHEELDITENSKELSVNSFDNILHDKKILLVEDVKENIQIFTYYLEATNVNLDVATDGLTAVEKGLSGDYDLILMDIQIPHLDGREVTRRLREQNITCPIIALTAHAQKEEVKACIAAGCNFHISKPTDQKTLITAIVKYI